MAMAGAAAALAGCSVDSHATLPVPKMMLAKEPEPPRLDPQPDVKQLVRDKLDSVFTAASHPRHVRVSPPRRQPNGPGWTACIRAELRAALAVPVPAGLVKGVVTTAARQSETAQPQPTARK